MTNFEKIKEMPVEDLAVVIMCHYDTLEGEKEIMPCIDADTNASPQRCYECCLNWLKGESKNG